MINNHTPLPSLINNNNGVREIFETIINYFDPFKNKNRKTKVLDVSNSYYWNENTIRLYDVTKTNKIHGSAKDKKYNIIIFEPPRNRNFDEVIQEHISMFYDMLHKNGIMVVRITDFKFKGHLRGSYDVINVCDKNNFFLSDTIIYKNKYTDVFDENNNYVNIIHSSFMIFKKEIDSQN